MSFLHLILPQFQSLLNILVSKYVNTGDRLLDNAMIAILSAFLGILISYIPIFYAMIFEIINTVDEKSQFKPLEVNEEILKHDNIVKYKYKIKVRDLVESGFNTLNNYRLNNWIVNTYGDIYGTGSIELEIGDYIYKPSSKLMLKHDPCTSYPKMPIYRYFNGKKVEYIIYYDNYLYCNDLNILETFVKQFYTNNKTNEQTVDKHIYEVNEKGEVVKKGKINVKKSFDRLHFDQKNTIIKMLDKFKSNTMYPNELSLDNKIGCLLYGPPGTAKTATCIATAIYLNRDILILSSLLSTPRSIILDVIEKHKQTHVIILDEFDYILSRKCEKINYTSMLEKAQTPEELKKAKTLANECKISDEEFMLKLLDGITDNNGRVIFATTNSVEKINPKYLRPGRFDMILELSYCSFEMFVNICNSVYKDKELYVEHVDDIMHILSKKITPVILINAMIRTSSFVEMLDLLKCGDIEAFKHVKSNSYDSESTKEK